MKKFAILLLIVSLGPWPAFSLALAEEDPNKNILKQALLGAGTGAIASSASGGKAGKGALIGAGTNVIGGALFDTLLGGGSKPQQTQVVQAPPQYQYVETVPQQQVYQPAQYVQGQGYVQNQGYVQQAPQQMYQPVYVEEAPVYQEDPNKKILKSGLLGAGTGAIAASASGGSAGKGALIGAGTNVIGGALLDTLTGPSQPQQPTRKVYYQPVQQPVQYQPAQQYQPVQYQQPYAPQQSGYTQSTPKKKIIRKYDSDGQVVSEEEVWE